MLVPHLAQNELTGRAPALIPSTAENCTNHTLRLRWRQCDNVPNDLSYLPPFDMLPAMDQVALPLKFCPDCAAQMPDSAAFCPGCGRSMRIHPAAVDSTPEEGTKDTKFSGRQMAAAFAYATFLPALLFLFLRSYRGNSFVRFHSVQCLLCWLIGVAVTVLLRLFNLLLMFIPVVGPLLSLLLPVMVVLAAVLIWIVLLVKAVRGERFGLPLIGAIAEQYSAVPQG